MVRCTQKKHSPHGTAGQSPSMPQGGLHLLLLLLLCWLLPRVLSHRAVVVWEWYVRWFICYMWGHLWHTSCEDIYDTLHSPQPAQPNSALKHWDVVEYSEEADFVHVRTCPTKDGWHERSTILPSWPLLQTWACPYVSLCSSTWDWWLGSSPEMGEGGDLWSWPRRVIAKMIPRGCQFDLNNPLVLGRPTISFQ